MKIDKKIKGILIGIIITVIILIFTIVILNSIKKSEKAENVQNDSSYETEETQTEEEKNEEIIKQLKKVSESERIRTYLGTYFRYIENKEYDKAYDLLYQDFRNNYFPSIEDFEKYIKEQQYPEMLTIEYDEIRTQGEYYIVKVKVDDFLPNTNMQQKEIELVVKENNYNDYYISFTK